MRVFLRVVAVLFGQRGPFFDNVVCAYEPKALQLFAQMPVVSAAEATLSLYDVVMDMYGTLGWAERLDDSGAVVPMTLPDSPFRALPARPAKL